MSNSAKSPVRSERQERHHRKLSEQPITFLGLFLVPFAGLFTAWLIHIWAVGISINVWRWHWHVAGNLPALVFTACAVSVGSVGLGVLAWNFAEHRKAPFRVSLAASTSGLGFLFAISVGVGPHRWWSGVFVLTGWYVAIAWSLARLNVTRQDPREQVEAEEPGFLKRLTGWKMRSSKTELDHNGSPLRTDIEFQHAPGDVTKTLQDAVPNIESYAAAPSGLSRAVPTDRSDRTRLSVMHQDPLAGLIPLGPPSHPGGSVAEPATFSIYDTGHPVWCCLFGGRGVNPTGYGFMGVTRSGKTVAENLMLTDAVITRNDGVILYLNKAKGMQDARPIFPGIEVAILTNALQDYVSALNQVLRIMDYRQRQLSAYGISAWSARRCFHEPPQRKANGETTPMEPMPALIVHIGEADAVYESPKGAELADYIASKGLSLGVIQGNSLQRATADKMPSNLRFNISAWWCFGTGDAYSAAYALSDRTLSAIPEAGRPDNWKASRPGNFFFEGPGVDESLWPVRAKTQMLAPGTSPNAPQDEIDSALQEALLARCREFAPQMAKLDRGSVLATGDPGAPQTWWELAAAETDRIRDELIGAPADMPRYDRTGAGPMFTREPVNMTASDRKPATANLPARPQTWTANRSPEETENMEVMDEIADEIRSVQEVEGVELYPAELDSETANVDPLAPLPPTADPDDEVSWEDPRPEPRSRNDALRAFHAALRELIDDPALRDPREPDGNTVLITPGEIHDRYPYRSRPWFSEILIEMAEGALTPPPTMSLARAEDYPPHEGKYRLRRLPDDPQ
jgi:hypothetical protein